VDDEQEARLVILIARIMWADGYRLAGHSERGDVKLKSPREPYVRDVVEAMLRSLDRFVTAAFVKLAKGYAKAEEDEALGLWNTTTRAEQEQSILDAPPPAMRPDELDALASHHYRGRTVTDEDARRIEAFVESLFAKAPDEPPTRDDLPSLLKGEGTIPPPKDGAA
jgi:hypothetical protein